MSAKWIALLVAGVVFGFSPFASGLDNPRVAPGKIRWHKDFETACESARESKKPVLLFQMMGRLDEKFC